ncbi:MAG: dTDP-4-dehydrorhamnose reductase [Candidatus Hodarchaeota archaeon]
MKLIITGAKGQLAGEFSKVLQNDNHKITSFDRESLDVSDSQAVLEAISHVRPDVVINCAAYNFVDKAEEDFETAFRINAFGPKNLASACKRYNAFLVHYSTDYVFNGEKRDFYTELDEPDPINNYGKSKLSGEDLLKNEIDNFLLFRVSWVYGEGRQNFLYKLKNWAEKNSVIRVVCDQISVPTYTEDIVRFTMKAIDEGLKGMYHLTNSGYASRYEVARYFIDKLGLNRLILPVNSDYFNPPDKRTAKRPYFSAMSNGTLSKDFRLNIPDWRNGIDRFVERLRKNEMTV